MKGCKNCPAYAKCTVTYRGSACAALRGTYGIDSDPEIITNADRIRAMSDEELAEFINRCTSVEGAPRFCRNLPECDADLETDTLIPLERCSACLLHWLKQPAKEDA